MKDILETTGEILELVKEFSLEEIEIDSKDLHIRLSTVPPGARSPVSASTAATLQAPAAAQVEPNENQGQYAEAEELDYQQYATIASPMVGTFYRRPAPDKPPYVEENDMVNPGQSVCIIEAMKLMNEIKSDIRGKIVKILVENEQPVQEGQVLFLINPE